MDTHIQEIALAIDEAIAILNEEKLLSLIELCATYLESATGTDRATLLYFKANAYSGLVRSKYDSEYSWSWEQHEAVEELLSLRLAINDSSFEKLNIVRQCQIRTNLANRLNSLGRSVEAIEQWDSVLSTFPKFAMALGNRAYGLNNYSRRLYDYTHRSILLSEASKGFGEAMDKEAFWDSGEDESIWLAFESRRNEIEQHLNHVGYQKDFNLDSFELGETIEEQNYRQWCLQQKLFLNPLNDGLSKNVAASDVLHLPSHCYDIHEKPRFPVYFNHMKQEFVSARFRLFNALELCGYHFSDHEVAIFDNADGGEFGHHTEEIKSAFRAAYSLFDKIGMFLNDYYKVGLRPRDATFRRVWSQTVSGGHNKIRDAFLDRENWPLRGLYYLSKDIFDADFSDVAEPDARELATIRNYAEHRFITLQHYDAGIETDDYRLAITTDKFIDRTLRILKMARAGLIYLSMSMYVEEEKKDAEQEGGTILPIIGPIPIIRPWDDDDLES